MAQFNRRQWLKTAGLSSGASLLAGLPSLALAENTPKKSLALQDDIIRLSSNENPFGPSEKVRSAMIDAFDVACRYPFGYISELAEMIAKKEGVTPEHIVITAGSTEGLKICGLVFGVQRGEIIAADPVYKSLISYAEEFGCYINKVPHNDRMEHDLEEMEKRISQNTQLVFFCNPTNPCGTIVDAQKAEDFCHLVSEKTILFSDEAYYDYIAEPNYPSMTKLVKQGKNVIVSKTFSKVYGLAGIRIGYLIARPDLARRISEKRMAGPNILAIHAAKAALQDEAFYQFSLKENQKARNHLYQTLDELNLHYVPSHTNFVFFHAKRPIQEVISAMLKHGVRVGRPFPPLTDWCRVSTGRMEDMEKLRAGLRKVFA